MRSSFRLYLLFIGLIWGAIGTTGFTQSVPTEISYDPDIPFIMEVKSDSRIAGPVRIRAWTDEETNAIPSPGVFIEPDPTDLKDYIFFDLHKEKENKERTLEPVRFGMPVTSLYNYNGGDPKVRNLFVMWEHKLHLPDTAQDELVIKVNMRDGEPVSVLTLRYRTLATYVAAKEVKKANGKTIYSERSAGPMHEFRYENAYAVEKKRHTTAILFGPIPLWAALENQIEGRKKLHELTDTDLNP